MRRLARPTDGSLRLALWLAGALLTLPLACSSSGGGGEAGDAGAAGDSGSGGSSGASGGTAGTSTSGDAGAAGVTPIVGTFNLTLVEPSEGTEGYAAFSGKVFDGPVPDATIWKLLDSDGDCQLLKPVIPFCDGGCGTGVCVADGQCQEQPSAHSVGDLTLTGISTVSGATSVVVSPILKGYSNPAGITFSYPPAAEGTAVTLDAAGGDYSAFTLEAPGIAPLVLAADSYPISSSQPLSFSWTPAAEPSKSHILVHLDISHHGGSKGKIECDTADDGALQINASLMSQLLALGVAGYPTVTVTRRATGEVTIAPGRVTFNIQQNVERAITVEGVTSCTSDADCTGGMTCASDLTCQ